MSFSVVIVTHESAGPLPALLDSLRRHAGGAEVIVVDTGSRDDSAAIATAAGAQLIRRDENPGFGAACNAGIEAAHNPVTVLLNPDCELIDDGLGRLSAAAARRDALFVPRLVGEDGLPQRSAHPLPATPGALIGAVAPAALLPAPLRLRLEPWRATSARTVGWAIAACMAARTGLLRRLGPFDPAQFLFYEDLDLCLRARRAGVPTVFVPEVSMRHAGAHSTRVAYDGEPHAVLAARRREVVRANLGARGAAVDEVAQTLTFATRLAGRMLLRREHGREREQLRAQRSR